MDANSHDNIARLLAERGVVTREQLLYAQRIHGKLTTPRTLLSIMRELGYFTQKALQGALFENHLSIPLGSLLLELEYITAKELHWALHTQKDSGGKRLGEILVDSHIIEENQLLEVISCQVGLPVVEPDIRKVDQALVAGKGVKWFERYRMIPLRDESDALTMVFADPLDEQSRSAAQSLVGGAPFRAAIAARRSIETIIRLLQQGEQRKTLVPTSVGGKDDTSAVTLLDGILEHAISIGASDIHLEPLKDRLRIRMRKDGVLMFYRDLDATVGQTVLSRTKALAGCDITDRRRHQGGRIEFSLPEKGIEAEIRVSTYVTIHGEKIVLRVMGNKASMLNLEEVGMTREILASYRGGPLDGPGGVVVITGPTGAGKTTTLYASINYLKGLDTSIITAEDPVEAVIDGVSQCGINPAIGLTYEETLRHIVRQDPDVIVIGEIRDDFSAKTAIQAALTGHKVLTTLHTEDSIGGVLRLLNMGVEAFLISSAVICIVAQRLLRRVCPHCATEYHPSPADLRKMNYRPEDLGATNFRVGMGCEQCSFTGYNGRLGVFEVLVLNEQVKESILAGNTAHEIRRVALETTNFVPLFEDGISKAARGDVSLADVFRFLPKMDPPRPIYEIRRLQGE